MRAREPDAEGAVDRDGVKIHYDYVWSEVRKGNRTGFSIHGKGIRKNQPVDEIMGYA